MPDLREKRTALIPLFAEHSPQRFIGRTTLMKYMYFLQSLRGVPLGYRFTLYSYGPFDSEVLADLATAETLGAVECNVVSYSGGYGYRIRRGSGAKWLQHRSAGFLNRFRHDVRWVVRQFGGLTSGQIELVSTIVYVDQEEVYDSHLDDRSAALEELVSIVKEIKPHFSFRQIEQFVNELAHKNLLESIS